MKQMEDFGKAYTDALDAHVSEHSRLNELRRAVLNETTPEASRTHGWAFRGVLAASTAAVTLVIVILLFVLLTPSAVTFTVGEDSKTGEEGAFIAADAPVPLRFSDGTQVTFLPGTDGRVDALSQTEVRLSIDTGSAQFNVVHTNKIRWAIDAGPYRVHVVGTRFQMTWSPANREFLLVLNKGEVIVEGPSLHEQRVGAGQTLRVSATTGRATLSPTKNSPSTEIRVPKPIVNMSDTSSISSESKLTKHSEERAARKKGKVTSAPHTWLSLAKEARYTEAVAAARKVGIEQIVQSSSDKELFLLAETTRLAGDSSKALSIYKQVCSRFAGTPAAHDAAFMIGRTLQKQNQPAAALQWFETYLHAQPNGRYTMEASGRRFETLHRLGRPEATAAASAYLEQYPSGNHAHVARQVLETQTP